MKTYAPSLTKRCAAARPIPLLPPVITAILPANFFVVLLITFFFLFQLFVSRGRVVHLRTALPPFVERAQYNLPCAVMLFRHNLLNDGTTAFAILRGRWRNLELQQGGRETSHRPTRIEPPGAGLGRRNRRGPVQPQSAWCDAHCRRKTFPGRSSRHPAAHRRSDHQNPCAGS